MSSIVTVILIGLSLSMDAFSLSLAYGIIGLTKRDRIILSLVVGIFHFIMPLIGHFLGSIIESYFILKLNIIAMIILIYLGMNLIMSNNDIEIKHNFFIFGLSVSIDSLMVGIILKSITHNFLLSSIIFMIISSILTYTGLVFGGILGKKTGKYSKIVGGITLIVIAIILFVT